MESERLKRLIISGIIIVVLMLGVFGTVNYLKTKIKYDYNTVSIRVLETVNYIKTNRMAERITKNFGRSKDELLRLTRFFPYSKPKNWSENQSDMNLEDGCLLKRTEKSQDELLGASNLQNWSKYQGNLNWVDAKSKCVSIGMRLPTKDELKVAYESGGSQSWENSYIYWSSTPNNDGNTYVALDVHNGLFDFRSRIKHYHIRCIH